MNCTSVDKSRQVREAVPPLEEKPFADHPKPGGELYPSLFSLLQ